MKRSLGTTLLATGAAICALGAVGLTLGMFVTIPEAVARAVLRAVGFSAPFLVGGALMLAGAAVRRASRASPDGDNATADASPPRALPAAHDVSPPAASARERVPASRSGPRDS